MEQHFTIARASAVLAAMLDEIAELIRLRADLTAAVVARQDGDESVLLADVKALEARVGEILDGFRSNGVLVKGYAPLLLDFPIAHRGRELQLCWLEGERELAWYHDAQHGFVGRRPLSDLD